MPLHVLKRKKKKPSGYGRVETAEERDQRLSRQDRWKEYDCIIKEERLGDKYCEEKFVSVTSLPGLEGKPTETYGIDLGKFKVCVCDRCRRLLRRAGVTDYEEHAYRRALRNAYLETPAMKEAEKRKIGRIIAAHFNSKLESIVTSDPTKKIHKDLETPSEFRKITITREALEKAHYIARRVCELAGRSLEVQLLMVNPEEKHKEGDYVARDVYIIDDQEVEPAYAKVVDRRKAYGAIGRAGMRVVGKSHSHGNAGVYHSHIDDASLETDSGFYGRRTTLRHSSELTTKAWLFPSLVVNTHGDINGAIGVAIKKVLARYAEGKPFVYVINHDVEVAVVEEKNNISLDREAIDEELYRRVTYRGKPIYEKPLQAQQSSTANKDNAGPQTLETVLHTLSERLDSIESKVDRLLVQQHQTQVQYARRIPIYLKQLRDKLYKKTRSIVNHVPWH